MVFSERICSTFNRLLIPSRILRLSEQWAEWLTVTFLLHRQSHEENYLTDYPITPGVHRRYSHYLGETGGGWWANVSDPFFLSIIFSITASFPRCLVSLWPLLGRSMHLEIDLFLLKKSKSMLAVKQRTLVYRVEQLLLVSYELRWERLSYCNTQAGEQEAICRRLVCI